MFLRFMFDFLCVFVYQKITTTISGVDVWQNVTVEGKKKNTYTFYIDQKTKKPQRYVMMGYDSLLGSHYDKYIIEYSNYEKSETDPSQFNPPKGWFNTVISVWLKAACTFYRNIKIF